MALTREIEYDEVFDAQDHFRSLLDGMARPGKLVELKEVSLQPPRGLSLASASVCLALLNRDASYALARASDEVDGYLRLNCGSPSVAIEEADFILCDGSDDAEELVERGKEGVLTYPEGGATFVIAVGQVSHEPLPESLGLKLHGPGVDGERCLWARGLNSSWAQSLSEKNAEFPLGVDTMLTFTDSAGKAWVCCLPRSTRFAII